jgi:integrase
MGRDERRPRVDIRRRRLADGSISEVPTVRWLDALGTWRRRSCATVEEAELERARLALELGNRGRIAAPAGAMTIAEFWPTYRADIAGRLAEATLLDYDATWRRRVQRRFGEVRLADITPRVISRWRAELQAQGVGPEAIRRDMLLLQAMFTLAVEWGETDHNPVALVRKPRQGRTRAVVPLDPLSVERIRARLLEVGNPFSATLVSVLAYSGVRPGEALALERRHIRADTILVEQAVSLGKLKVQKTGRAYRTVDLLPSLRDDLGTWLSTEVGPEPDDRLFPRSDGHWLRLDDWNNWRNRHFHSATRKVRLGKPRAYDLRHSFASLLIREGQTSIVEIAEQLGHSPTETLKTYAHVFSEYRRQPRVPANELIARARQQVLTLSGHEPMQSSLF